VATSGVEAIAADVPLVVEPVMTVSRRTVVRLSPITAARTVVP
jgi:hypothetical protein